MIHSYVLGYFSSDDNLANACKNLRIDHKSKILNYVYTLLSIRLSIRNVLRIGIERITLSRVRSADHEGMVES